MFLFSFVFAGPFWFTIKKIARLRGSCLAMSSLLHPCLLFTKRKEDRMHVFDGLLLHDVFHFLQSVYNILPFATPFRSDFIYECAWPFEAVDLNSFCKYTTSVVVSSSKLNMALFEPIKSGTGHFSPLFRPISKQLGPKRRE